MIGDRGLFALRVSEHDRRVLTAAGIRTGSLPDEFVLAAALAAAARVIAKDLQRSKRRLAPRTGWRFVDVKWLQRNAHRLPRLLGKGRRFILVIGVTPIAWLVGPDDADRPWRSL